MKQFIAMKLVSFLLIIVSASGSSNALLRRNAQQTLDSDSLEEMSEVSAFPEYLDFESAKKFLGTNDNVNANSFPDCKGDARTELLQKIAAVKDQATVDALCGESWRKGNKDGMSVMVNNPRQPNKLQEWDGVCKRQDKENAESRMKCILGLNDDIDAKCSEGNKGANPDLTCCESNYNRLRLGVYYYEKDGSGWFYNKEKQGKAGALKGWSMCANLQFLVCGATGNLPHQRKRQGKSADGQAKAEADKKKNKKPFDTGSFTIVTPLQATGNRATVSFSFGKCKGQKIPPTGGTIIAKGKFEITNPTTKVKHSCEEGQVFTPDNNWSKWFDDMTEDQRKQVQTCKATVTLHEIVFLTTFCANGKDLYGKGAIQDFDCEMRPNMDGATLAKLLATPQDKEPWAGETAQVPNLPPCKQSK